ncbi:hypothetical protein RSSM_04973 [Rhodopirellula sallentina SM41]|uniref:Uncharacterized protein n=1 Tax=Rhodopirellula sallentina SM41 TaxID=1263870 RepID=M5UCA9_9BACT|nr:hypothetical protein RSSM_04973 [Rhodopirellula sallentina SM41]
MSVIESVVVVRKKTPGLRAGCFILFRRFEPESSASSHVEDVPSQSIQPIAFKCCRHVS